MKTIAFVLLALCHGAWALEAWDGTYVWQARYGQSKGGSPLVLDYRISLAGPQCRIALDGYQTEETLLCTATADRSTLTLRFASHANGALTNAYGVAVYQPGQALLRLQRLDAKTLRTTWLGLTGLDGKLPQPGIQFRKK